jgi:hypothetical protein
MHRQARGALAQRTQVLPGIDPISMPVGPTELQCIIANDVSTAKDIFPGFL